jgi:two-component sensor histidine kinase
MEKTPANRDGVFGFNPAGSNSLKWSEQMHVTQSLTEKAPVLVLREFNHRIRNLLEMIESVIRDTESTTIEEYRATLMARISGLVSLHAGTSQPRGFIELLEQTMRPHSAIGAQVLCAGPDFELEPNLALALNLVFHELAANSKKYGALSSPSGCVTIEWGLRHVLDATRKLAITWTEHGGPEVKPPRRQGFGLRLIKRALEGYGAARWDFDSMGLACFMLIDLQPQINRSMGPFGPASQTQSRSEDCCGAS